MTNDPDIIRINANIKRNIFANGFTLSDVARGLGVSVAAISQALRNNLTFKRVYEIAGFVGVSVDDLIKDDDGLKSTDAIVTKCPHCGKYVQILTNTQVEIDKIGTN